MDKDYNIKRMNLFVDIYKMAFLDRSLNEKECADAALESFDKKFIEDPGKKTFKIDLKNPIFKEADSKKVMEEIASVVNDKIGAKT